MEAEYLVVVAEEEALVVVVKGMVGVLAAGWVGLLQKVYQIPVTLILKAYMM